MTHSSSERHLDPAEIAAYVDRTIDEPARRATEMHLLGCPDCRCEVIEVSRVMRTVPRSRSWPVWIPAAAAAAVLLIWIAPSMREGAPPVIRRDDTVTLTSAPHLLSTSGTDASPTAVWSAVPAADRYRIRLFDVSGTVLWERETTDTVAVAPDSVPLRAGTPYYWKLESHSGFGRWSGSELVEFVAPRSRGP